MSERATFPSASAHRAFWPGPENTDASRARDVLAALRGFREADAAMRESARAQLAVNETDLVAIRHLIRGEARSTPVTPKDLSTYLGISSAATAKLLARLSRTGHIRREAHAVDGRVQLIFATTAAHREVRRALGSVHARMFAAAEDLDPAECGAVIRFLRAVAGAMAVPGPADVAHSARNPEPASADASDAGPEGTPSGATA
jgi:DNA-binding MarR family transcriptional regulator